MPVTAEDILAMMSAQGVRSHNVADASGIKRARMANILGGTALPTLAEVRQILGALKQRWHPSEVPLHMKGPACSNS